MLVVTNRASHLSRTLPGMFHPLPVHVIDIVEQDARIRALNNRNDVSGVPAPTRNNGASGNPLPRLWEGELVAADDVVVVDIDLSDTEQVWLARNLLPIYRGAAAKRLFLVDAGSHQNELQARALGATDMVRRDAPRADLIVRIRSRLAETGGPNTQNAASEQVSDLAIALEQTFDAVRGAGSIDATNLSDATGAVIDAAREQGIQSLLDTIWHYDDATFQHCLLVTSLAAAFGLRLGFSTADCVILTKAALVHDIGKAAIPLDVLNKPGKLTDDEFTVVKTHTTIGYDMLVGQAGFLSEQLAVVRSHHEYLDGSGYPDGLANGEISDLIRLVTITDICAALIERRPYKQPMPPKRAYAILSEMHGKLDMDLLRAFKPVIL